MANLRHRISIILFIFLYALVVSQLYLAWWLAVAVSLFLSVFISLRLPLRSTGELGLQGPNAGKNFLQAYSQFIAGIRWQEWLSIVVVPVLAIRGFVLDANFLLRGFADRITGGMSVFRGIDVGRRGNYVVLSVTAFVIMTMIMLLLLFFAAKRLDIRKERLLRDRLNDAHYFALLIIFLNVISIEPLMLLTDVSLLIYLGIIVVVFFETQYRSHRYCGVFSIAASIFVLSTVLPLNLFFLRVDTTKPTIYLVCWILILAACTILPHLLEKSAEPARIYRSIISLIMFTSIGLALPFISEEIGYILLHRTGMVVSFRKILLVSYALLLLAGLVFVLRTRRKTLYGKVTPSWIVRNVSIPLFICGLVLYGSYTPTASLFRLDWFHHGEELLPAQQLMAFGKIPYIDIMPTHGLDLTIIGVLNYVFHGSMSPDSAYFLFTMDNVISALVAYFFLTKVFRSPLFSLFVALYLTPLFGLVFDIRYIFVLFFLIPLSKFIQKPSPSRLKTLSLVSAIAFLLLRREASLIFLLIVIVFLSLRFFRSPKTLVLYLARILIPIIFILAAYLGTLALKSPNTFTEKLRVLLTFMSPEFQTNTNGIVDLYGELFVGNFENVYYFLLPLIVVILAVRQFPSLIDGYLRENTPWRVTLSSSSAVLSILVWTRAFHRHTLAHTESYAIGFFSITILMMLFSFYSRDRSKLVLTSAVFLIFLALTSVGFTGNFMSKILYKEEEISVFSPIERPLLFSQSRFVIDDYQGVEFQSLKDAVSFIKGNLTPGQTFLFLSYIAPFTYIETNMEYPNFIIPHFFLTGDMLQNLTLREAKPTKVPIYLFSNSRNSFDGVDDKIRNYKIFEHVYQNYRPIYRNFDYVVFGLSDAFPPLADESIRGIDIAISEIVNANRLDVEESDPGQEQYGIGDMEPRLHIDIADDPLLSSERLCSLSFEILAENPEGRFRVRFIADQGAVSNTSRRVPLMMQTSRGWYPVNIDISSLEQTNRLVLDLPVDLSAEEIKVKNLRFIISDKSVCPVQYPEENLPLGQIPYLWANYDPKDTFHQAVVREDFFQIGGTGRLILPENSEIEIEDLEEFSGNLGDYILLKIDAQDIGSLDIDYRADFPYYSTLNRFNFDVNPGANEYLIRMSAEYNWVKSIQISRLVLRNLSDLPVEVTELRIVNGP